MRRATTTAVIFLLLTCLAQGAFSETTNVRILIGSREAVVAPPAVYDGTQVLVPLRFLDNIGVSYITAPGGRSIGLIASSGQTADVETANIDGATMVPADKLADFIGAGSQWDKNSSVLRLTSRLQSVEFVDGVLKINCSLPVSYSSHIWDNKLVIDIDDASLSTEAKEVYIGSPLVERARLGEPGDGSARVVLDLKKQVGWKFESDPVTSQIRLRVAEGLPRPVAVSPKSNSASGGGRPFTVTAARIDQVDPSRFVLVLATSARGTVSADYGVMPPQIVLKLKGGTLASGVDSADLAHPLIKAVRMSGSRVVLDLNRIVAYDVVTDESAIRLHVRLPDHAGGSLAGKLVVIDPGHGGSQAGATYGGQREKDINLRMAREVAEALEAQGARTILTRTGDSTLSLGARPQMAVSNGADFFISLHCNSNGLRDSATGIETYYHLSESSPRSFAYAIHAGVCATTGMCDRGARSDTSLGYTTGLAVLRGLENTGLPGVLVECGYLNHSSDRQRLCDANYRKKLAAGIVAGLKAYVEGTPLQ